MKYLFVTGSMRSGTTFIANLINAQDECVVYRDFLLAVFRVSSQLGIHRLTRSLSSREKNVLLSSLQSELFRHFQNIQPEDFSDLRDLYYLALAQICSLSTRLVGVKVTQAEDWIDSLLKETETLILVVIRDLRDVLLSAFNRFSDYRTYHFALNWYNGVMTTQKYRNNPRVCIIRFEDLITSPHATLASLSHFLGISFSNIAQLQDFENEKWIANSGFHDVKVPFDTNAVYRWKSDPNSREVLYALANYRSVLKQLGYEVFPLTLREKVRFKKHYYVNRIPRLIKKIIFR